LSCLSRRAHFMIDLYTGQMSPEAVPRLQWVGQDWRVLPTNCKKIKYQFFPNGEAPALLPEPHTTRLHSSQPLKTETLREDLILHGRHVLLLGHGPGHLGKPAGIPQHDAPHNLVLIQYDFAVSAPIALNL